jgi:methylated-DNA-protein-cysteine methyltransferase related protein
MNELEIPLSERDAFFEAVWKIVHEVPPGKVATYGQIAGYIPCPKDVPPEIYPAVRARWVGQAMAASPSGVPWQRVINSQGKISGRAGAERQRSLLEGEGIPFDERQRIDLKRYGWQGPSPDWLRSNNLLAPDEPQQLSLLDS